MASTTTPPPSSLPPSLGPGARPASDDSPGSTLREVMDIRRSYSISVDANATTLHLGYQLDGQARRYSIPFENMPIGGLTRRLCFGGVRNAQVSGIFVIDTIRGAENMTGDQLSQAEAEGFARHAVKRIQYAVFGNLAAVAGGYALAYRGIATMKFPFMRPKPADHYTAFPSSRFAILRGSGARLMWQLTRFNVYAAIALFAAGPVFASMGDVSMMAGLYQDSRTRSVLVKMKDRGGFNRIASNRSRPGQPKAKPQQEQQQRDTAVDGDYNDYPAAGYDGDNAFSDDASPSTPPPPPPPPPQSRQQPSLSPTPPASSGADFFFDDASPVAADASAGKPRSSARDGSGESVWSRIRRGNAPAATASAAAAADASTSDASFSGQSGSQAAAYEQQRQGQWQQRQGHGQQRQQAQREFDAIVEQERRLGEREDYWQGGASTGGGAGDGESAWERRRRA